MVFIQSIIEFLDPDLIVASVSAGFLVTSILIGNYISKPKVVPTVPIDPVECPPLTLKESINFLGKQKRALKKLKVDLFLKTIELQELQFHRKHVRTILFYGAHWRKVRKNFDMLEKNYKKIAKKIAFANRKSVKYEIDLLTVKRVLAKQSQAVDKLYIPKPTLFSTLFSNLSCLPSVLAAAFKPVVFVLLVYLVIVHWKTARNAIVFLLTCTTSSFLYIWWKYFYDSYDTYWTSFKNMLYIVYLSFVCFYRMCESLFSSYWSRF